MAVASLGSDLHAEPRFGGLLDLVGVGLRVYGSSGATGLLYKGVTRVRLRVLSRLPLSYEPSGLVWGMSRGLQDSQRLGCVGVGFKSGSVFSFFLGSRVSGSLGFGRYLIHCIL